MIPQESPLPVYFHGTVAKAKAGELNLVRTMRNSYGRRLALKRLDYGVGQNEWAESCWTFTYKNTVVPAAGTYTGRVLYTLTAP